MAIELNKSQKDAVYYFGEKPLLIEAGPGSGKTRVIIDRVKFLINDMKLDPSSFLIITFTRKAARELREKLKRNDIDEEKINKMQISTIHSFCYELLKENLDKGIKVLDDDFKSKKSMFIYKNKYELGFKGYKKLKRSSVGRVLDLFDEFSTFSITDENLDELTKYIEVNFPVSEEYKTFVMEEISKTGRFPEKKIKDFRNLENEENDPVIEEQKKYKMYWENSVLSQIPQAYKVYLNLLKEEKYLDYGILQKEALEYLKEKPVTQYKNILIDEFQDTDPIQNEIFKILLKEIVNENEKDPENIHSTFTVVGDIDQSIYRFRGAYEDYFKELSSLDFIDAQEEFLDINYRSTKEIVDFCDNYISHQRERPKLNPNEKKFKSSDIYFIENDDRDGEAEDLIKIIKKLKEDGIIREYNEITVLFRSVVNDSKSLTKKLDENAIPYQVSDVKGLENRDEIKFILNLMEFVTFSGEGEIPFIYDNKLPWLKLTEYSDDSKPIFHLSYETKECLKEYHKDFVKEVVRIGKEEYEKLYTETLRRSALSGIFKEEEEFIINTFKRVKIPVLNNEELENLGITNKKDLNFFKELNKLKDNIFELRAQKVEIKGNDNDNGSIEIKKCDSLKIFYKLLEIAGYLDYEFIINKENRSIIENLGLISSLIMDYENIYHEKEREITEYVPNEETGEIEKLRFKVPVINIFGLLWSLNSIIRSISLPKSCENGVDLMTVHKAKGLESPVVIVAGLNDNHFPKDYKYLAKRSNNVYFTPNRFLDYKNETEDEELINHNNEEERIIYVAMTRAKDLLILSKHNRPKRNPILTVMENEIVELSNLSNLINDIDGIGSSEILNDENGELSYISSLIGQIKENGADEIKAAIDDEIESIKNNLEITKVHKNRLKDLIENKDYVEKVDKDTIENISFRLEKEQDEGDGNDEDDRDIDPIYLSHSSINRYEKCPFAYNLSYNFSIKPSSSSGMEYGTISHNVLENLNNRVIKDKNILITKEIIEEQVKIESEDYDFDEKTINDIIRDINIYWEEKGSKIDILESEYKFKVLKNNISDDGTDIVYTLNGSIDLIYKENGDLYILDYKTGFISEEFKHSYANQLYTYALALKSDPNYRDEEIKGLQIYSLKYNDIITIDFDDEKLETRENEIGDVAKNIIKGEFSERRYDGGEIPGECEDCPYKFICLKDID